VEKKSSINSLRRGKDDILMRNDGHKCANNGHKCSKRKRRADKYEEREAKREGAGSIITWSVEKQSFINSLSRVSNDILMRNNGHKCANKAQRRKGEQKKRR
jgi:hypothetical protein